MITEMILDHLYNLIKLVLSVIPHISFNVPSGVLSIVELISRSAFFFPIDTFVFVVGSWIVLNSFDFSYQVIMWAVRKIPGVS